MKNIFAVIMAAVVMLFAVSCSQNTNTEENKTQTVTPSDEVTQKTEQQKPDAENGTESETESQPIAVPGDVAENGLSAISYETFKDIIGLSMAPYDSPLNVEKNMVHAVTGFNGDVELTYFSFVMRENADAYLDELMAVFPAEPLMHEEDGIYEIWKTTDEDYSYMAVRIGKTIIFGSSKVGFEALEGWFYGLGYVDKR